MWPFKQQPTPRPRHNTGTTFTARLCDDGSNLIEEIYCKRCWWRNASESSDPFGKSLTWQDRNFTYWTE